MFDEPQPFEEVSEVENIRFASRGTLEIAEPISD
jgi:hypothetical protein